MYKIAFIDLDGTLLNSEKQMSEFDKNILLEASKKINIVFASARGFNRILPFIKEIDNVNKNSYTLAFNGSLLINNTEDFPLINNCINKDNLTLLLNWIYALNLTEVYAYNYEKSKKLENEEILEEDIYKIVILENEEHIKKLREKIPHSIKQYFEITSSEKTRIEFVQKGMTKQQAISQLLDHLNIPSSEMIAIGDGENDISMLKMAGLGIAMENASEEVKKHADIITDSNDDSGVGKILKTILSLNLDKSPKEQLPT